MSIGIALLCAGCVSTETVQFVPKPLQEPLTRDGVAGIVSRGKSSIVIVKPASRSFAAGGRPTFVVGMNNLGKAPVEFRVAEVSVNQSVGDQTAPIKVITYEELVSEERTRQIVSGLLVGAAAGLNAASAANAGRYNSNSTVHTSRGTYHVHTSGYSPTAAAIAQSNAAAQNDAMISATVERGQQNMAALERSVIKDNTLLAGEWYGGQLVLSPPASEGQSGRKTYAIALRIGADMHEINVVQAPVN